MKSANDKTAQFQRCRHGFLSGNHANSPDFANLKFVQKDEINTRALITAEQLAQGRQAILSGEVLPTILAGGLATRFGRTAKAAVPLWGECSFLEIKLRGLEQLAKSLSCEIPALIIVSQATEEKVREIVDEYSGDGVRCIIARQPSMPVMDEQGTPVLDRGGRPQQAPTGHGDILGTILEVVDSADLPGNVSNFQISNIDNPFSTLDPGILGHHIGRKAEATIEVVLGRVEDVGGYLVRDNRGRYRILEGFMVPIENRPSLPFVFSSNTFTMNTTAAKACLNLDFHAVRKKSANETLNVQFERVLGDVGLFTELNPLFVERDGEKSRFFPIKTPEDIKRQKVELEALLRKHFPDQKC